MRLNVFLASGIDIFPFKLPLESGIFADPERTFDGLSATRPQTAETRFSVSGNHAAAGAGTAGKHDLCAGPAWEEEEAITR